MTGQAQEAFQMDLYRMGKANSRGERPIPINRTQKIHYN